MTMNSKPLASLSLDLDNEWSYLKTRADPAWEQMLDDASLSPEEVAAIHASVEYVVHAIGFCPGFPYLGYLPAALCGMPRLPSPRLRVEPGSVGLTGRQTGIYPLPRPGGWRPPADTVGPKQGAIRRLDGFNRVFATARSRSPASSFVHGPRRGRSRLPDSGSRTPGHCARYF